MYPVYVLFNIVFRNLIIPNEKNNFTAHLLHRNAILIYITVIFVFNFLVSSLGLATVSADISLNELLEQHNTQRVNNGLGTLTLNENLNRSATLKANAMMASDCWSHYCPDGKSPWDFFGEANYEYTFAGENLAEGFENIDSVINAWMNSPTHRENLLNANFNEVGFGIIRGDYQGKDDNLLIAVHFGKRTLAQDISVSDTTVNPDVAISIDNLKNGEILNQNHVEVKGTVKPENSKVEVLVDSESKGRVDASGESYTFRTGDNIKDGVYKVESRVVTGVESTDLSSAKVEIIIDGDLPFLIESSVRGENIDEKTFLVEFKTSEDVIEIETSVKAFNQSKNTLGNWEFLFERSTLDFNQSIEFNLFDRSKNSQSFKINVEDIKKIIESTETTESQEYLQSSLPVQFLSRIKNSSVHTILPLLFISYILVLFAVDYLVLAKTKMLSKVGRKSHIYFGVFFILFISIALGGIGGNIMTGITL